MQKETFKPMMLIVAVCTFAAGMITAMYAAAGYFWKSLVGSIYACENQGEYDAPLLLKLFLLS